MVAGFTTMYQIVPGLRISLILMCNRSGKHVGVWNEADEILFEAFGLPKTAGPHPSHPMPE